MRHYLALHVNNNHCNSGFGSRPQQRWNNGRLTLQIIQFELRGRAQFDSFFLFSFFPVCLFLVEKMYEC